MLLATLQHHPTLSVLAGLAFIAWRVYSRVRRLVARQRSRLWLHRASVLFFPTVLGFLALGVLGQPKSLAALAGGILAGAVLSLIGLRLSRFEVNAEGAFYTPCAPLGIGLSAILISRLVYRGLEIAESHQADPGGLRELSATPITLLVFGTLASYYSGYAAGLLRWRRRVRLPRDLPP